MKKFIFICICAITFTKGVIAQANVYRVDVPQSGLTFTANTISLTNVSCTLVGNVTQQPIMRLPAYLPHNVPGILTNIDQIGNTWVIQCTAGPGYCFTWYDAK